MDQRGRKSAAQLAVVRPLNTELPAPPDHFDDEQAQLWCEVVATKPADWWDAGTYPLLETYVRTIVEYRKVSEMVEKCHPLKGPMDFEQYEKIQKMQDRLHKAILTNATKMRLSQQSKYGARQADTAAKSGSSGKPWE